MTPQETWMKSITDTLTKAGFTYTLCHGFPLVDTPNTLESKVKLLQLHFEYVAHCRIYADGMIVTPIELK